VAKGVTIRIESTAPCVLDAVLDELVAEDIAAIEVSPWWVEVAANGDLGTASTVLAVLLDRVVARQPRSVVAARISATEFLLRPAAA
jgi:hypothetical protein